MIQITKYREKGRTIRGTWDRSNQEFVALADSPKDVFDNE